MTQNRDPIIRLLSVRFFADPHEIYNLLFVGLVMAAYIIFALSAGPDLGWDLKNYHYYVGHAFWHGGFEKNIFPAQVQGWFNPLLDALLVGLMEHLRPILATAILALLQSLNMPLLYILIRQSSAPVLKGLSPLASGVIRGAALVIGAAGAMTLSEVGTSFSDLLVTLPLLASLVAVGQALTSDKKQSVAVWIAVAGFCFGAAVGLKLTMLIFVPGLLAASCCLNLKPTSLMLSLGCFVLGSLAGLLISDGFWLWHMYQMTGNPFFPAINGLFHSNWIAGGNLLDTRFRAQNPVAALQFFADLFSGQHPGAEVAYYDLRFLLVALLSPFALYYILRRRLNGWSLALVVFFYISFFVWLTVFGIMRYSVPLEILSGVVAVIMVGVMASPSYRVMALGAVTLLLCFTTQVPQWGPHLQWNMARQENNWFGVAMPPELTVPNQMFLMLTGEPLSYVIPFFPPNAQFVRMEGNLNPPAGTVLYQKRLQAIAGHAGPFLTLGPAAPTPVQNDLLGGYGLLRTTEPCISIPTNTEILYACPLKVK